MKLAWITDSHLDFVRYPEEWWSETLKTECDAFVFTGDVSNNHHLTSNLLMFTSGDRPVYFVLGNHDYYGGSIEKTRRELMKFNSRVGNVSYLNNESAIRLTETSCLIGDDGWYDGRNGSYARSSVELNDFTRIQELTGLSKEKRLLKIQSYAGYSAVRLKELCAVASQNQQIENIFVATHVPPFQGASWHEGRVSESSFLPFFSNRVIGEALVAGTQKFRDRGGKVTVICGHTHSEGTFEPCDGMVCLTGSSKYGYPRVYSVLDVK